MQQSHAQEASITREPTQQTAERSPEITQTEVRLLQGENDQASQAQHARQQAPAQELDESIGLGFDVG
jgi:hypothetical protein